MAMNKKISYTIIGFAVITIGVTLWLYFSNFNGTFSEQSSDWGNFGSYINSISPILVFLNIILIIYTVSAQMDELKKQRETSYLPHLSIAGCPFTAKSYDNSSKFNSSKYPHFWELNKGSPTLYFQENDRLALKLFNIGLGAASQVKITFDIDYENIVKIITCLDGSETCSVEKSKLYIDYGDGSTSERPIEYKYPYTLDFFIQSKEHKDYFAFDIPDVLIVLNSLYFYLLKSNNIDVINYSLEDFISTIVNIEYYDISGNAHQNQYKLTFVYFYHTNETEDKYYIVGDIKVNPILNKE